MKKISNEFCQGELTIIYIFLVTFEDTASKDKKKKAPFFQVSINFYPCHPQQQTTGNSFSAVI